MEQCEAFTYISPPPESSLGTILNSNAQHNPTITTQHQFRNGVLPTCWSCPLTLWLEFRFENLKIVRICCCSFHNLCSWKLTLYVCMVLLTVGAQLVPWSCTVCTLTWTHYYCEAQYRHAHVCTCTVHA